jgi:hypothetical protein
VGRIKTIEAGADGIYVTAALNADGISLLAGEAPKYTGHSPFWRLAEIPGRAGHYRPILLWSDALTNMPNIMTNTIAAFTAPDAPIYSPGAPFLLASALMLLCLILHITGRPKA